MKTKQAWAFVLFAAGSMVAGEPAESADPGMDDIRFAVAEYARPFQRYRIEWSMETTTLPGALNDLAVGFWHSADGMDHPAESETLASSGTLITDGDSVRSEMRGDFTSILSVPARRFDVSIFTSGVATRFMDSSGATPNPQATLRTSENPFERQLSMGYAAEFAEIIEGRFLGQSLGREFTILRTEQGADGPLIVVGNIPDEAERGDAGSVLFEAFLDPSNHYLPVRQRSLSGRGELTMERTNAYAEDARWGSLPSSVSVVLYSEGRPSIQRTTRLTALEVNPSIAPDTFAMVFPDGTTVTDLRMGIRTAGGASHPIEHVVGSTLPAGEDTAHLEAAAGLGLQLTDGATGSGGLARLLGLAAAFFASLVLIARGHARRGDSNSPSGS